VAGAAGWCRGRGAGHPGAPPGHETGLEEPPCHCKQEKIKSGQYANKRKSNPVNNVCPATYPPNKTLYLTAKSLISLKVSKFTIKRNTIL
jgi:hypothetical protein